MDFYFRRLRPDDDALQDIKKIIEEANDPKRFPFHLSEK